MFVLLTKSINKVDKFVDNYCNSCHSTWNQIKRNNKNSHSKSQKNCTYDNLSQDYKQQTWPATFDGNQLVISGKNGKKAMTIYLRFDDELGNRMSGTVGNMDVVLYR